MPAYRIFRVDRAGKIARQPEWIAADCDEDAIAHARAAKHLFGCEVWERDRLVAQLRPERR